MFKIFLPFYLFFSSSIFAQNFTIKNIEVKSHMVHQNYEHFKRLVLDSPDSEAEYIHGFDFEWGYDYTIKVKETEIGPLSDGTNFEYSLVKIIKKEKVADTVNFLLVIDPLVRYTKLDEDGIENYALKQINDSLYLYMNEVEILISEILKEAFEAKLKKEKGFLGSFVFVNENRIKLIKIVR